MDLELDLNVRYRKSSSHSSSNPCDTNDSILDKWKIRTFKTRRGERGSYEYLVGWAGFSSEYDSWLNYHDIHKLGEIAVRKFNAYRALFKNSISLPRLEDEIFNKHLRFGRKVIKINEFRGTPDLHEYFVSWNGLPDKYNAWLSFSQIQQLGSESRKILDDYLLTLSSQKRIGLPRPSVHDEKTAQCTDTVVDVEGNMIKNRKLERVLDQREDVIPHHFYVSWVGLQSKHNSWLTRSNIYKLGKDARREFRKYYERHLVERSLEPVPTNATTPKPISTEGYIKCIKAKKGRWRHYRYLVTLVESEIERDCWMTLPEIRNVGHKAYRTFQNLMGKITDRSGEWTLMSSSGQQESMTTESNETADDSSETTEEDVEYLGSITPSLSNDDETHSNQMKTAETPDSNQECIENSMREIEEVLAMRLTDDEFEYQVSWRGLSDRSDSWVSRERLENHKNFLLAWRQKYREEERILTEKRRVIEVKLSNLEKYTVVAKIVAESNSTNESEIKSPVYVQAESDCTEPYYSDQSSPPTQITTPVTINAQAIRHSSAQGMSHDFNLSSLKQESDKH